MDSWVWVGVPVHFRAFELAGIGGNSGALAASLETQKTGAGEARLLRLMMCDGSGWIRRRDGAAVYGTVVVMAKPPLLALVPPRDVTRIT